MSIRTIARTRYLLYQIKNNNACDDYRYNAGTLAICEEELKYLFPDAGEKIYVTFSSHPIANVAVSDKFKVVPYRNFGLTLEYNGFQYVYLYRWLREEIAAHKNADGFVYIGVENCTDVCDKCLLERDSDGFCKYGCDDAG